jgi:hypothetical protein
LQPDDPRSQKGAYGKYLRYSHVGLEFFIAVALFTAGGIWLDRQLEKSWGTEPLFTVLGFALGFAGGFVVLYREVYGSSGPRPPAKKPGSETDKNVGDRAADQDRQPKERG